MLEIKEIDIPHFEKVIEATDPENNLHAFIAIHNTSLGPALGGVRFYPYSAPQDALNDALRLSKAMSYKSAVVSDGLGGGKSVIIGDPAVDKTDALLFSFAEAINSLKGSYIAAEDVGTTVDDMLIMRKKSPYIAALPTLYSSGDPSRFTAWGVIQGLHAVAKTLWNKHSLKNRTLLVQGLGNVGSKIVDHLFWEGADILVSDIDKKKTDMAKHDYRASVIDPEEAIFTECDILVPCALGGVVNEQTSPFLQCRAIAGSANNQLASPEQGRILQEKGILYAPDYIINAGGIINAASEFDKGGYDPKNARDKTNSIYDTLMKIFDKARKENKPTNIVADEIAEYNIRNKIGCREGKINFDRV